MDLQWLHCFLYLACVLCSDCHSLDLLHINHLESQKATLNRSTVYSLKSQYPILYLRELHKKGFNGCSRRQ